MQGIEIKPDHTMENIAATSLPEISARIENTSEPPGTF
jgi:hypothetical protein